MNPLCSVRLRCHLRSTDGVELDRRLRRRPQRTGQRGFLRRGCPEVYGGFDVKRPEPLDGPFQSRIVLGGRLATPRVSRSGDQRFARRNSEISYARHKRGVGRTLRARACRNDECCCREDDQ